MLFVIRNENTLRLTTLFYKYDNKQGQYVSCLQPTMNDLEHPCFVLHGISTSNKEEEEYKNAFNNIGAEKVISLDSASHPQYSGKKLSHLKDNLFVPIHCVRKDGDL